MLGDPLETGDDVRSPAAGAAVQHLHGVQSDLWCHAHHLVGVSRSDGAGHPGAVAVVVVPVALAGRTAGLVALDHGMALAEVGLEVGVSSVDAAVDVLPQPTCHHRNDVLLHAHLGNKRNDVLLVTSYCGEESLQGCG